MKVKTLLICLALSTTASAQCGPEPAADPPWPDPVAEPVTEPVVVAPTVPTHFAWDWGPFVMECEWHTVEPAAYTCMDPWEKAYRCFPSGQCFDLEEWNANLLALPPFIRESSNGAQ